jgi:phage terminase small subunit
VALNPKQNRFVAEYLKDLNGTQAAIRAGYAPSGADVQATRLLANVSVRRAIDEALARRASRVEVKSDDILRELMRLAMVDVGEAFDDEGRLKPLKDMPVDVRRAIAGIEVHESPLKMRREMDDGHIIEEPMGRAVKVRFWDKTKGLELLGKHLKLFTDKVEHSGALTLEQLVLASMKKPEGE